MFSNTIPVLGNFNTGEGEQNFLPQNMPLWDIDYLRLVNFKEEQT